MKCIFTLLSLASISLALDAATTTGTTIATIKQGKIQGVPSKSRNGLEYTSFWGVPYARPPSRFQAPEPHPGWKGVRNATVASPLCIQLRYYDRSVVGKEDCLYANVFTKNVGKDGKDNKPVPVIVHFHLGAFMYGSGDIYGADYFMDESVVLVTFNYRLTSFGFLNVGHFNDSRSSNMKLARGNMGLQDQVLLLHWVHENIASFGGDPGQVTAYGYSAGAASVVYQLLNPLNKGKISRAIVSSGAPLDSWGFVPNPTYYAEKLGKALHCDVTSSEKLVKCLLTKDATELAMASYIAPLPEWPLDPITPFGPSIDSSAGSAVTQHPETVLKEGRFLKVPVMTGVCAQDGWLYQAAAILADKTLTKTLNEKWNKVLPVSLSFQELIPESKWNAASQTVRKFYIGGKDKKVEQSPDGLEQMYSDRFFIHGVRSTLLHLAKSVPVFPYVFDRWAKGTGSQMYYLDRNYTGKVFHGDDVIYAFSGVPNGLALLPGDRESVAFSKKFVKMIVSFVKSGVPDASLLEKNAKWPKTSAEQTKGDAPLKWFYINNKSGVVDEKFADRMKFWDDLFKKY